MSETQDLDAIEARYEATTPGVWDYITQGIVGLQSQSSEDAVSHPLFQAYKSEEDGVFVAHAHQDVPALIGEVERLTAQLQAAQATAMLSDEQLFEAYRVGYHQVTGTAAHPNGLRAVQAAIRAASAEQTEADRGY